MEEKEVREDLVIYYKSILGKEKITCELRYRNVTKQQAFELLNGMSNDEIISFTWE